MTGSTGILFDIKRYAIHDGPHIRTTVFFKGCPLHCWWCHNPEGLSTDVQMVSDPRSCIDCRQCIESCPQAALTKNTDGILRDDLRCEVCGSCRDICPALVHKSTGWQSSIAELMQEILKDRAFYDESGGGVTFSGGEPLMQPEFLIEMLQACGAEGIHRCVDTSAHAPSHVLQKIMDHTDLFLVDLKHLDDRQHRIHTGIGNRLILQNIALLAASGIKMRIRIPLIPGVNDDADELLASAHFIAALPGTIPVDILPYHNSAESKYRKLGMNYRHPVPGSSPSLKPEQALRTCHELGLSATLGG